MGLWILVNVVYEYFTGTLSSEIEIDWSKINHKNLVALLLALPIPLHVISIGLIIQKKWLYPKIRKVAWIAITASGIWLGMALLVKLMF